MSARARSASRSPAKPDFEVLDSDEIMTKRELAVRLNMSLRTIERSGCPAIILEQRPGAKKRRFRRRYVVRVALAHFASLGRSGVRLAMLQLEAA